MNWRFVLLPLSAGLAFGQLSLEQKVIDFQALASLYAKQYAPYEWKREAVRFDLYQVAPWLDRVRRSTTDLEFYEVLAQYVASLDDVHASYLAPSTFIADLGLGSDLYDNRLLIDFIDRILVPPAEFPLEIGDEIVSIDGRPVDEIITELGRQAAWASPRATRRWVADFVPYRPQVLFPRAAELPDASTVVFRKLNGDLVTYRMPWTKTGRPLRTNNPVPTPRFGFSLPDVPGWDVPGLGDPGPDLTGVPRWKRALVALQYSRTPKNLRAIRGFGARAPIFALPANFRQRLGASRRDFFFSGTFEAGGKSIGFIRIPSFAPLSPELISIPLSQFDGEIAFMRQNTDGLVIDVMRNPGGFGCYATELLRRLIPYPFRGLGLEIRATLQWANSFQNALELAILDEAEEWQINLLRFMTEQVEQAFRENRGLTGPIFLCSGQVEELPVTGPSGQVRAYEKPIMLLTDEFTTSAGDIFAALFQDAQRGRLFGFRTAGAGGSVVTIDPVNFYSEGAASVTQTLVTRARPIATPEYPTAALIENIGVRPDVVHDYMTRNNLLNRGRGFVTAFTESMVEWIERGGR